MWNKTNHILPKEQYSELLNPKSKQLQFAWAQTGTEGQYQYSRDQMIEKHGQEGEEAANPAAGGCLPAALPLGLSRTGRKRRRTRSPGRLERTGGGNAGTRHRGPDGRALQGRGRGCSRPGQGSPDTLPGVPGDAAGFTQCAAPPPRRGCLSRGASARHRPPRCEAGSGAWRKPAGNDGKHDGTGSARGLPRRWARGRSPEPPRRPSAPRAAERGQVRDPRASRRAASPPPRAAQKVSPLADPPRSRPLRREERQLPRPIAPRARVPATNGKRRDPRQPPAQRWERLPESGRGRWDLRRGPAPTPPVRPPRRAPAHREAWLCRSWRGGPEPASSAPRLLRPGPDLVASA